MNLALSAGLFLWGDHLREVVAEKLASMQVSEAMEHSAQWPRVTTNPNGLPPAAALEVEAATVISATTATSSTGGSAYSSLSPTAPAAVQAAQEGAVGLTPTAAQAAIADAAALLDIIMALSTPHDGMLAADASSTKKRWRNAASAGPLPLEDTPAAGADADSHSEPRAAQGDSTEDAHQVPFVGRHTVPAVLARCIVAGAPSLILAAPVLSDDTLVHALHTLSAAQAVAASGPVAATTESLVSALGVELGHRVATRGVGGAHGVPLQLLSSAASASLSLHAALSRAPGTTAASAAGREHGPTVDAWVGAVGGVPRDAHSSPAYSHLPSLPVGTLGTHAADVLASARDVVAPPGGRGLLHAAASAGATTWHEEEAMGGHETHQWENSGVGPSLAALAADALSSALQADVLSGRPANPDTVQAAVHTLHEMRVARIKGQPQGEPSDSTPVSEQALSLSLLNALGSLCDQHDGQVRARGSMQLQDVYPPMADCDEEEGSGPLSSGSPLLGAGSALEQLLSNTAQATCDVRRQTLRLLLETQALPPMAAPSSAVESCSGGGALMSAAYCSVGGPSRAPAAAATTPPSVGLHTRSHAASTAVRVRAGIMSVLCSDGPDAPVLGMPLRELALLAKLSVQGGLQRGAAPPPTCRSHCASPEFSRPVRGTQRQGRHG